MNISESIISFPREELPSIWGKRVVDGKEVYYLLPEVREKILGAVKLCGEVCGFSLDSLKRVYIVGSIGTNQYEEDTDIDVHIVIDYSKVSREKSPDDYRSCVKEFNTVLKERGFSHEGHVVEIFVQNLPDQDFLSDSVYDVIKDCWVIGPSILPLDFNPYSAYLFAYNKAVELSKDLDVSLGKLRRGVIDYLAVKKVFDSLDDSSRGRLLSFLRSKLVEVENSIVDLLNKKRQIIQVRRSYSAPKSREEALTDLEKISSWKNVNAVFKFLSRYQYISMITDLEKMVLDKAGNVSIDDGVIEDVCNYFIGSKSCSVEEDD